MSKKREHYPEQDPAESDASERRLTNDANDRDESPPSGSSRLASVRDRGDVSDFLADEIGALDSMRHKNARAIGGTGTVGDGDVAEDQHRSGLAKDVDEPRDAGSSDTSG